MRRDKTKAQVAQALGVSVRTVDRWLQRGCPSSKKDGKPRLSVQEVRRWRQQQGLTGRPGRPKVTEALPPGPAPQPDLSAPAPSKASLAKAELARKITIAKRAEMELACEKSLKDLDIAEKIRAASTYEDLVRINKEVGALVASGSLLPARGQAVQRLLAEARHNLKAHHESTGGDDSERIYLLTEEGAQLVDAFEGIVSDARRERLLQLVRKEAEVDALQHPNVDTALSVEQLEEDPDG